MRYLLDTNVCIELLRNRNANCAARLAQTPPGDIALCSPVLAELVYGAHRSRQPERHLALVEEFRSPFGTIAFDDRAAMAWGVVRAELAQAGTPIGPNDLLIASIALANDLTVVTNNTREFLRVPNLRIEDWSIP